ncbi:MAG: chorismate mutase [Deltaproteobacteria bacterium]|nr:chorismate mutase [Deltaproteobacteria bacterium]
MDIADIRTKINQLDDELLRIFNERAALALEIGAVKKKLNRPIYDPKREKLIFERMKENNPGPLDDAAIVRLFERVIDESRSLERSRSKGE